MVEIGYIRAGKIVCPCQLMTFHQRGLCLELAEDSGRVEDGQTVTLGAPLGEGLAGIGVVDRPPTRLEDLEDDDDDEELLDDEEIDLDAEE